ncbi:MAG: glycosyltransferase [Bacteroidota bacterium]
MGKDIYLSIVIPAFNEAKILVSNLNRIQDALNTGMPSLLSWEIIVCDNNSTDETTALAEAVGARVVHEPINQISRARNTGAKAANGQWLLFLDADSYPTPSLIQDLINLSLSDAFIGCGTTVCIEGGTLFSKLRMERLNPIFRLLNIAGGVCLLCEKQAFDTIGGFSTDLYAYEEFEFIKRLKRHGKSVNRSFTVLHQNPIVTSGRKGALSLGSLMRMLGSNLLAILLFVLRPILPKSWHKFLAQRGLGFWYKERK